MPANRTSRSKTLPLGRAIAATVGVVAIALLVLPAPAGAQLVATTQPSAPSYEERFARALETCQSQNPRGGIDTLRGCVYDLAAPDPTSAHEVDIWRIFLDCLSLWYKHLDDMYPSGFDVNECLESHGVDVQPW